MLLISTKKTLNSPSADANPVFANSRSLTDNTAYLKDVLQAVQPIAICNICQEEWRKLCRCYCDW
jgi:hypothetical protein